MIEVGRVCVKIAGRDAGKKCVIVDVVDDNYVLIDGQTRRRKCNVKHIEPLKDKLAIKKGATHSTVVAEFKKLKIEIKETKKKDKPKTKKPVRTRKTKKKPEKQTEKLKK